MDIFEKLYLAKVFVHSPLGLYCPLGLLGPSVHIQVTSDFHLPFSFAFVKILLILSESMKMSMNTDKTTQTKHDHMYCHRYTEPLIFQFILSHYLVFAKAIKTVITLSQLLRLRPKKSGTDQAKAITTICQLQDILAQVAPNHSPSLMMMPWHTQAGALSKLLEFNHALTTHAGPKKFGRRIHTHATKTLNCCHELSETLKATTPTTISKPLKMRKMLMLLDSFIQHSQRLEKAVLHAISQLQCDENLVFFLLRHDKEFDRLHGKGTIKKLLNKLFPKGIDEAVRYVTRRYQKRGFDHLIPMISKKRTCTE